MTTEPRGRTQPGRPAPPVDRGPARTADRPTESPAERTAPTPASTRPAAPAKAATTPAAPSTAARTRPDPPSTAPAAPVRPPVAADRPPAAEAGPGAVVTAAPQPGAGSVRRARLTLRQVDPWSVMKISFVLSIAAAIVLVVAVWLLWQLLAGGDVFVSVDQTIGDIAGSGSTLSVVEVFSLRRVMGVTLMLAVVQVVLITALATLAAFLYNLASGLVGGLEVTLADES